METPIRKYIPGSQWLYAKIYTGVKTADIILEEAIQPLLQHLKKEDLIKKWFFIRYNDPKSHLRIRFELSDTGSFDAVLSQITSSLEKYIHSGEISDFRLDTYDREIERYGGACIEDAEFLFWKSSHLILHEYLHFDDEEKIIVALFYIDEVLKSLELSMAEKLEWIRISNLAFKKEFHADKNLNSQLDKKYRAFKPGYLKFLESEEYEDFRTDILNGITESSEALQRVKRNCSEKELQYFFQSIFHMNINRIFISNQRLFEMIIYDYLYRYYKTLGFKNSN
ncbi:thiopeptide-type bacteriocin biosynthesis protein [Chryseobacterium sp. SIMBA_029]|uniref:thiopeptide-type bacteriocin biosynthesis protein n=1 Tax=Chryseobacterium sp. SIMBA_029 TaxID=3085772 RepID=UPI003978D10C